MNFMSLAIHFQSICIVITDQICFWSRRGQMSHRFFKYQVFITKFQNLQIIYTEGKNVAFPDILSRNTSLADAKLYQLVHKVIPKDIKFYINGKEFNYSVLHQDDKDATANDCYPIIAQVKGERRKLLNINDGDFSVDDAPDYADEHCRAIHSFSDCFRYGTQINQIMKLTSEVTMRVTKVSMTITITPRLKNS